MSTGWAAKLAATDSNWKKKIEDDKKDAKSAVSALDILSRNRVTESGFSQLESLNSFLSFFVLDLKVDLNVKKRSTVRFPTFIHVLMLFAEISDVPFASICQQNSSRRSLL